MTKKYELTDESIEVEGHTLYRIRSLKSLWNVSKGKFGGYIESESNLSQEGTCWVYKHARVYGDATVEGNAVIANSAVVSGNARIFGYARVASKSTVSGHAQVHGNAQIGGHAQVYGNADVHDDVHLKGNTKKFGDADTKIEKPEPGPTILMSPLWKGLASD